MGPRMPPPPKLTPLFFGNHLFFCDYFEENITVNCANTGREEEFLNIANINLLVRFNKTREIFPSVT